MRMERMERMERGESNILPGHLEVVRETMNRTYRMLEPPCGRWPSPQRPQKCKP